MNLNANHKEKSEGEPCGYLSIGHWDLNLESLFRFSC